MKFMLFLIVDDSPVVRRIIINYLEANGYYSSIEASDGREALSVIENRQVDFIITDWLMPDINGLDLVKLIRKLPNNSDVPIIMLTTKDEKSDVLSAIQAGADDYIVKPFTFDILTAKVQSVLQKRQ